MWIRFCVEPSLTVVRYVNGVRTVRILGAPSQVENSTYIRMYLPAEPLCVRQAVYDQNCRFEKDNSAVEWPALFVPVDVRETGMKGAGQAVPERIGRRYC